MMLHTRVYFNHAWEIETQRLVYEPLIWMSFACSCTLWEAAAHQIIGGLIEEGPRLDNF